MENINENTSIPDNSMNKRCKFVKKSGEICNAIQMKNSDFCYFHSPETEEERKQNIRNGGKKKVIVVSENVNSKLLNNLPFKLRNAKQVSRFYELLINETLAGNLDLRYSTGISYILSGLLKSLELSEMEERIINIEKLLNERIKENE
jgi:hypothetical protein